MFQKKHLSLILSLAMIIAVLTGCSSSSQSSEGSSSTSVSAESTTASVNASNSQSERADTSKPADYPKLTDEAVTLSVFAQTNPNMSEFNSPSEFFIWSELSKRTNVSFTWIMSAMSTATEQFNLLVAGDNLPDLVLGSFWDKGDDTAVDEEVYQDISGYLEQYASDYLNVLEKSDAKRTIYSDEGRVTEFAEIGQEEFPPNNGILIRQDMLDKVGSAAPVTYDDYYNTLTALKTEYNMDAPFFMTTMDYDVFSAGYGVNSSFCLSDNGDLIYSPITDEYREYLKTLNKWYTSGLVYHDFYSIPSGKNVDYMVDYMGNSKSAVTFAYCEFANMIKFADSNAKLAAGYIPRQTKDQQVHLTGGIDDLIKKGSGMHITTNCSEENTILACELCNYFYTDEGALLCNYGIEGQTFNYDADGKPWFTDLIITNPDGLTQTQALCYYLMYQGPCYADYTKYNISSLTTWKDFISAWSTADNKNKLPTLSLTPDEQTQYANIASDVETYMDEVTIKFITGEMSADNDWETYISNMESIGVKDMIAVYQTAYDRYKNK